MKKVCITIENTETDYNLLVTSEGFDKSLNAALTRGNMAIEAYAMAVAGVLASIPPQERPAFLAAFCKQVLLFASRPEMKTEGIQSVRDHAGQN